LRVSHTTVCTLRKSIQRISLQFEVSSACRSKSLKMGFSPIISTRWSRIWSHCWIRFVRFVWISCKRTKSRIASRLLSIRVESLKKWIVSRVRMREMLCSRACCICSGRERIEMHLSLLQTMKRIHLKCRYSRMDKRAAQEKWKRSYMRNGYCRSRLSM